MSTEATPPPVPAAEPERVCRSSWYADTNRRQHPGDREVRCGLVADHADDHEELDHNGEVLVSWPRSLMSALKDSLAASHRADQLSAENARLRLELADTRTQLAEAGAEVKRLADALTNVRAVSADRLADRDKIAHDLIRERDAAARAEEEAMQRATAAEAVLDKLRLEIAGAIAATESFTEFAEGAAARLAAERDAAEERYRQLAGEVERVSRAFAAEAGRGYFASTFSQYADELRALAATAPQTAPGEPTDAEIIIEAQSRLIRKLTGKLADARAEPSPAVPEQEREPAPVMSGDEKGGREFRVTREECEARISGVCPGCGGEVTALETVDNSNQPTHWSGCTHCGVFTEGVPPDVHELARKLVEEGTLVPYPASRNDPFGLEANTREAAHILRRIERVRSASPDEHYQAAADACTERNLTIGLGGPVGALVDSRDSYAEMAANLLAERNATLAERDEARRQRRELIDRIRTDAAARGLDIEPGEDLVDGLLRIIDDRGRDRDDWQAEAERAERDAAEARREAERLRGAVFEMERAMAKTQFDRDLNATLTVVSPTPDTPEAAK